MNLSPIKLLAQAVISQTKMYDLENTPEINDNENYLPNFLRKGEANADRRRVRHNVAQLFIVLEEIEKHKDLKKYLPKGSAREELTAQALCAILYAERQPMPLFEYVAAAQLVTRLQEDKEIGLFKVLDWLKSSDLHSWLSPVISYHKIATLTLDGRLRRRIYDQIRETECEGCPKFPLLLGLAAAAAYDTPGEDPKGDKYVRIRKIFGDWANPNGTYEEKFPAKDLDLSLKNAAENLIIAYDLPLCKYSPKDLIRHGFKQKALENFLRFWQKHPQASEGLSSSFRFATFHYDQARLLSYDVYTGASGKISQDFEPAENLENLEVLKNLEVQYEFVPYKYPAHFSDQVPPVLELRLREPYFLREALGAPEPVDASQGGAWESILDDFLVRSRSVTTTSEEPSYYPVPLNRYVPLPLIHNLLSYKYQFHRVYFEKLVYRYDGQLDQTFPPDYEAFAPNNEAHRAIIEKYLAAVATNIGVCVGFDRVEVRSLSRKDSHWPERVHNLLTDKMCGYELLLRYVEMFMRSHDVSVAPGQRLDRADYYRILNLILNNDLQLQKPDVDVYSVGVDIGAGSIKFTLYNSNLERVGSYRCGTCGQENYGSLRDFARVLIKGIDKLLRDHLVEWQKLDVVGITWPGVIRDQKIAGASGILKYFVRHLKNGEVDRENSIASNWIRHNNVEKIRNLDLISDLKAVLRENGINPVVFALSNDGYADALGQLYRGGFRENTWAVLKFGTGTAGAVIREGRILEGLTEFGKLVLNVFRERTHEDKDVDQTPVGAQAEANRDPMRAHKVEDENHTPDGDMNKYASGKLLPGVFRDVVNATEEEEKGFDSFEIGHLGSYYLDNASRPDLDELNYELGLNWYYRNHLQTEMSLDNFRALCRLSTEDPAKLSTEERAELSKVRRKLNLRDNQDLRQECIAKGTDRGREYLQYVQIIVPDVRSGGKPFPDGARDLFAEVFDRAGSVLADGIMLLRDLYRIDGVILCGGVFARTLSTERILRSIRLHLGRKYHVRFAGIDEYKLDCERYLVRKRANISTIYHNFPDSMDIRGGQPGDDNYGGIGALYHAKIMRHIGNITPDE